MEITMVAQARIKARLCDMEAFCSECPAPDEVTALLAPLGFHLVFSMERKKSRRCGKMTLPPLPAQYHYRDQHNTEIIVLAGQDHPEHGRVFPPHASHWWLYPGTSPYSYNGAMQALSTEWNIKWTRLVTSRVAAKEVMHSR